MTRLANNPLADPTRRTAYGDKLRALNKPKGHVASEALGMWYETAKRRLNRCLLFSLVQETGRDKCFQCGERILSISEFTIEHMVPWDTVEQFFDLSNIAYSHFRCNSNGRNKRPSKGQRYHRTPPGKSWCWKHQEFLDLDRFSAHSKRRTGVESMCRECNAKYHRERRAQRKLSAQKAVA